MIEAADKLRDGAGKTQGEDDSQQSLEPTLWNAEEDAGPSIRAREGTFPLNLNLWLQISEKNSALEQDFENEINKNNKNSKEIG